MQRSRTVSVGQVQPQLPTTNCEMNDLSQSRVGKIFRRNGIPGLNQLLRCCPGTDPVLLRLDGYADSTKDDGNNDQSSNTSCKSHQHLDSGVSAANTPPFPRGYRIDIGCVLPPPLRLQPGILSVHWESTSLSAPAATLPCSPEAHVRHHRASLRYELHHLDAEPTL